MKDKATVDLTMDMALATRATVLITVVARRGEVSEPVFVNITSFESLAELISSFEHRNFISSARLFLADLDK